jgi:hypothetical protein
MQTDMLNSILGHMNQNNTGVYGLLTNDVFSEGIVLLLYTELAKRTLHREHVTIVCGAN